MILKLEAEKTDKRAKAEVNFAGTEFYVFFNGGGLKDFN